MSKQGKSIRRASSEQEGFAIPAVIGIGLIIILAGTTMLIRSREDQIQASAQKATLRGISAAETGISQVQAFLNQNRVVAKYDFADWKQASSKISEITNSCNSSSVIASTQQFAKERSEWVNIDQNDSSKGQYRIVDYVYSPNPANPKLDNPNYRSAPGVGVLTVEGRVNQVGGKNEQAKPDVNTSTTRLQVTIPVVAKELNQIPTPGLWIKIGVPSGNQSVRGNLITNDCSIQLPSGSTSYQDIDKSTNKPYLDPGTNQSYQTLKMNLDFPALPTKPSPVPNSLSLSKNGTVVLPRLVDKTSVVKGQTVYEYSVADMTEKSDIIITPGQKVIFYLDGNIDKNTTITHSCIDNSKKVIANCHPADFQIYGYGPAKSYICLNGGNYIEAFIFAPNYSAGMAGGGNSGGFYGSLWVNDVNNAPSCNSNSNHTIVYQSASWNTLGITPTNLPSSVNSAAVWQRQGVPSP